MQQFIQTVKTRLAEKNDAVIGGIIVVVVLAVIATIFAVVQGNIPKVVYYPVQACDMLTLADAKELEEERRLAYVGITRARERLHVSRATVRRAWGSPQYQPASRFLDEIPADLIDWERLIEASARSVEAPSLARLAAQPGVRSPGTRPILALSEGDRVSHDAFGLGTVIRIDGVADKTVAHVDFGGDSGVKRLLLRYAPLVKL